MRITQSKSQISIEFILVIGILFLILTTMLFFSEGMRRNTANLRKDFEKTKECLRIARAISSVYANGDGIEMRTRINYDLEIKNRRVIVEDIECSFVAPIKNESSVTGKIVIKNEQNEIVVENY